MLALLLAVRLGSAWLDPAASAPALKAAFLYNFAKFSEWPDDAPSGGPVSICVLGESAVADALDGIVRGRTIDGRDILVTRPRPDAPLRSCHILYIGDVEPRRTALLLETLRDAPILTVADRDRYARWTGVATLFVDNGHMRFTINVDAAQHTRIRISSRVLSLATIVRDTPDVRH